MRGQAENWRCKASDLRNGEAANRTVAHPRLQPCVGLGGPRGPDVVSLASSTRLLMLRGKLSPDLEMLF